MTYFLLGLGRKELSSSQILTENLKNICLSPSKKHLLLNTNKVFVFSSEKKCNISATEIHLVRPTTKEQKITQFDVDTHDTIFV